MHIGPAFITHTQSAKLMQSGEGGLAYPGGDTEMAAVFDASLADLREDTTLTQDATIGFAVVTTVGLHAPGFDGRPSASASNRRHAIKQRHELSGVVAVGGGEDNVQRRAVAVDDEVVLAARLAPLSRIGTSFFPPSTARTDELSAITREKSSRSALRNLANRTRCSVSQTPAFCQSRARRQHVMPEPQPNFLGSISHGKPDCRINRVPVNTRRSSRRLRPGGVLRGDGAGSNGRTISHSSSSTSSRAMASLHRIPRKDHWSAIIQFC